MHQPTNIKHFRNLLCIKWKRFPLRFGYLGNWWAFTSVFGYILTVHGQKLQFPNFRSKFWHGTWIRQPWFPLWNGYVQFGRLHMIESRLWQFRITREPTTPQPSLNIHISAMQLRRWAINDLTYFPCPFFGGMGRNTHPVFSKRELMFTFAICRRPSVCRVSSVVSLLSACLSSVCNVRAPYSGD